MEPHASAFMTIYEIGKSLHSGPARLSPVVDGDQHHERWQSLAR
jgi:hypothetical protein